MEVKHRLLVNGDASAVGDGTHCTFEAIAASAR